MKRMDNSEADHHHEEIHVCHLILNKIEIIKIPHDQFVIDECPTPLPFRCTPRLMTRERDDHDEKVFHEFLKFGSRENFKKLENQDRNTTVDKLSITFTCKGIEEEAKCNKLKLPLEFFTGSTTFVWFTKHGNLHNNVVSQTDFDHIDSPNIITFFLCVNEIFQEKNNYVFPSELVWLICSRITCNTMLEFWKKLVLMDGRKKWL